MVEVTNELTLPENAIGMSIGVITQAQMKIWCIESMYMLKVVLNEKMQVLKGCSAFWGECEGVVWWTTVP